MHTKELGERGIIYQYDSGDEHVWKNGMVFTCDTFIFWKLSSIYVSFGGDHYVHARLITAFYVGVYEQRFYRQKKKAGIKMA